MEEATLPEAEGPLTRPPRYFEQPLWTLLGLVVLCAGPASLLVGLSPYAPGADRIWLVVIGAVWTLVAVVVVLIAVVGTRRDRRVWRELDTAGVRALARVTSATRVWCGEDDRCTKVRMRVDIPGRSPFTATHLVPGETIVEVGTTIPIDVHPVRDVFRLAA